MKPNLREPNDSPPSSAISQDDTVLRPLTESDSAFVTKLSASIPYFSTLTPYIVDMFHYISPGFSWLACCEGDHSPTGYVIAMSVPQGEFVFIWQLATPPASMIPSPAALALVARVAANARAVGLTELRYTVRPNSAHQRYLTELFSALEMNAPEPISTSTFRPDLLGRNEALFRVVL